MSPKQSEDPFAGGGEIGALARSVDWARTPLGPVETWSSRLRTTVGVVMQNKFPMLLLWGKELVQIYNDGYRPILGDKHPHSMGGRGAEVWCEIWHIIGPLPDGGWENAIKFTPEKGNVTIQATQKENSIVFAVCDTGTGVPPEALPHIFDRYWHTQQEHAGSRGLGLSIVKGIVEAHGGSVGAQSDGKHGSVFYFQLPLTCRAILITGFCRNNATFCRLRFTY